MKKIMKNVPILELLALSIIFGVFAGVSYVIANKLLEYPMNVIVTLPFIIIYSNIITHYMLKEFSN